MKLGVNSYFLHFLEFEDGLRFAKDHGAQAIEVALLGEPSLKYCDMEKLLADRDAHRARWRARSPDSEPLYAAGSTRWPRKWSRRIPTISKRSVAWRKQRARRG